MLPLNEGLSSAVSCRFRCICCLLYTSATVYMVTMGKEGLREAANQCVQKAHYAFNELTESGKYRPLFDKPFFMEFALTSDVDADKINKALLEEKIIGGYDLGRDYPQYKNAVLYAVTEKRTKEEIDKLRSCLLYTSRCV